MFKALSPSGFFTVVLFYFLLLFSITIWSSTYDTDMGELGKQQLLIMKIVQVVTVVLFFILPALMFALLFSPQKLQYFFLHKSPSFFFVLVSCILIITAMPFISYLEGINKSITFPSALSGIEQWMKSSEAKIQQIEDAFMKDQTIGDLVLNIFVIGFMAALSEEIFFRGLLQRSLMNLTKNIHLAVWVTAILFSAFHMQFYGFIPRVLLGAMLGYIYVWSGSLWASIIVHFLNNSLVLVFGYLLSSGYLPKSVETVGMNGESVALSWALPSMGLMVICLFLLNKMKKPMPLVS